MKKNFLILVTLVCFGFNTNAQEGSCKIPGTNDYVQVAFNTAPANNDKESKIKFVIANSTEKPLVSVRVIIKAEILYGSSWTEATLYDDYVYNVDPFKSTSVEFDLRRYNKIKNINIHVGNPSCE